MSKIRRSIQFIFSTAIILSMSLSMSQPQSASAQGGDGIKRQVNAESGKVSFIGPESGRSVSAAKALGTFIRPQDPAMALAKRFAPEFGLKNPERDLSEMKANRPGDGRVIVRYQQNHEGIPVMGGELIVNTNENGDLYSMNGEVSSNLSLSTEPTISAEQAKQTALQVVAKWYQKIPEDFLASESVLWIYDESLLHPSTRPAELVWRMEVTSVDNRLPLRELVLINAQRGNISLHFNQVDTAWTAPIQNHEAQSLHQPSIVPSIVKYEDLVVDQARNRLYGADKASNKIDVINIADLSVVSSYSLVNGALPSSIDLSPNGNELAVAQSGLSRVKFINLTNGTVSEMPSALSGSSTLVTDVIYGRSGSLYALSSNGLHVIDLTVTPHAEDATQYIYDGSYDGRFGSISSDKNTLYSVTGTCCSGYNSLSKYDISAGLTQPVLLKQTHLYESGYMKNIRLSMIDDSSVLVTTGVVYNTSNLTPKAKNFQSLTPAVALAGRDFYVTLYDNTSVTADTLYFYDIDSSYEVSSLSTGVIGSPGAITATNDGNTLFVSSTGGLAKFNIGATSPGTPSALPSSLQQYNDLAVDIPRGLVYGTDISGRIDVIDMETAGVVDSYLLPSGANPRGIDLSPDGSELAIALNGLEKVLFINPETGANIAEVTPQLDDGIYYQNQPFDLIYGKVGRLYSSGNPGSGGIDYVHVIDTATHLWIAKSPYPITIRTDTEFALNQSKTYLYSNQTFSPNNLYIYDVQTDVVTKLYQGPHGPVSAEKFTIIPDGSRIFTSTGQVWDQILQSQLGTLQGAPGKLIEYIPNQNMIVLSAAGPGGDVLKFINPVNYNLTATYTSTPSGIINEMEVAPDGSKLIININSEIRVINLDPSLPSQISIVSGSNQTAPPQSQFSQLLKVKLQNYLQQPLSGRTITFTAPASGASGKFANTNTNVSTAVTDANGIATSSAFSANSTLGSYIVKATAAGLTTSADFQLSNGNQQIKTYTAGNSTSLPGTFLCDQSTSNCTNGSNPHADKAHLYAIGTDNLYLSQHNRNGIDGNNLPIISTVHFDSGYANAFWSGTQMVYGDGYGFPLADDVVAHELTHGVTQYESNLFYYYHPGGSTKSFSDLWGEYYDQINALGNDVAGVKWQLGEDISGVGALRSMSNPPAFGDPDKMSSANYYEGQADSGGVHTNSGLNNKAVFLMVDGGVFNGKTISALGWVKTSSIYYEANTNLLFSGADYSDLYYALQQACSNLIGQKGIVAGNCVEVKDAIDAVEMNGQPAPNFNTDAPICDAGIPPTYTFTDDLETGTSNWTFTNGAYTRWQYDSPYGSYAQSGLHFLYANDYPDVITDASAGLASFVVPPNGYMHFAHAYDFESYLPSPGPYYYDGGVLEYSINGGSTWQDAGSLINYNGYKGTIFTGAGNPLSGRSAFVGSSHGYISTRLNLASLAGQTVTFRWRMGLDEAYSALGWAVDNIKVYNCVSPIISGNAGVGGVTLSYTDGTPKTVTSSANGSYSLPVSNNWSGTVTPSHACFTFSPASRNYNNVTANQSGQNYTAALKPAANCADITVSIGGANQGRFGLSTQGSTRASFAGVNNGPVKIESTNAVSIMGAERLIYKINGVNTSFSEMMGLPNGQLDNTYWLPWYNNVDLDTQLRFGNVSNSTATVHVSIGGTEMVGSPFNLAPGASTRKSFTGINSGPVKIESNVNIVAAERLIYKVNEINTSFSEMMALPNSQLDNIYWLPWYNNIDLDTQLRFANVSGAEASVHVYIGGAEMPGSPFTLAAGASTRVSFAGVNNGPVKIESDQNIVAAERLIYKVNGVNTSFSEMMGLPASQLNTTYWLPWYNNVDLDTQLRFANVSGAEATVHVYIGGAEMPGSPFTLAAGASTRKSFAGINSGPVKIESNVNIVAAERLIYKVNNIATSFSEMMGLPASQLDSTYWLPWYNNVDLDTQLRFGVP